MSLGVQSILLSTFVFGLINFLVKYLEGVPSVQIVFYRCFVTLLISGTILKIKGVSFKSSHRKILLLRGLFGGLGLTSYFSAIHYLPLSNAISLLYIHPIFTVVLAILINKDPLPKGLLKWLLLGLGAIFSLKFTSPQMTLIGLALGVSGAFFASLAYNMIRLIRGRVHQDLIIFYFPLVTLPLIAPLAFTSWVDTSVQQTALLILIGVLTQVGQILLTKAYTHSPPSEIGHYNYLTCLWAVLTGIIFFGEQITVFSLSSMALLIFAVYRASKIEPPKEAQSTKRKDP